MPFIDSNLYVPKGFFQNAHLQTVVPSALRWVRGVDFCRERLELSDGDFLDLDWLNQDSKNLVILSHGLEGTSRRSYMKGMAKNFYREGWDVLAWNFRGCSGEINRLLRFYHSGDTADLAQVIEHALASSYENIVLVGFSMGGNKTLKYLGEQGCKAPKEIRAAVALSVPCDLNGCANRLDQDAARFYLNRFLIMLRKKIRLKSKNYPNELDLRGISKIKTFREFDDRYTAPLHGFQNADDYYQKASSLYFLKNIRVPALLLSAQDDPFLTEECLPVDLFKDHDYLFGEFPRYGGHVGFMPISKGQVYWSEQRALEFANQFIHHPQK